MSDHETQRAFNDPDFARDMVTAVLAMMMKYGIKEFVLEDLSGFVERNGKAFFHMESDYNANTITIRMGEKGMMQ